MPETQALTLASQRRHPSQSAIIAFGDHYYRISRHYGMRTMQQLKTSRKGLGTCSAGTSTEQA